MRSTSVGATGRSFVQTSLEALRGRHARARRLQFLWVALAVAAAVLLLIGGR